ncbi:hypothetical protein [Micromonospora sp. NPDC023644]|uniref:hypothetical protein n=1 Tax=Micromonospora sp. NPDC023644 TaxID=3154321 RepID=UPI0033C209B1
MSRATGAAVGVVAALVGGAAGGAGVVVLCLDPARPPAATLGWLAAAWFVRAVAVAVRDAAAVVVAHRVTYRTRRDLLDAVIGLARAADRRPGQAELAYRASGVAIRWEPKPGQVVAPALRLVSVLAGGASVTLALGTVSPADAARLAAVAAGGAVVAALLGAPGGRTWRARAMRARLSGPAQLAAAAGVAAVAVWSAGYRPELAAPILLAGLLLVAGVLDLSAVDVTSFGRARRALPAVAELCRSASAVTAPAPSVAPSIAAVAYLVPAVGARVPAGGRQSVGGLADVTGPYVREEPDGTRRQVTAPELLVMAAALQRLVFATVAENLTLGEPGTVALPGGAAAGLPVDRIASTEFLGGVDVTDDQWSELLAARLATRLADPDVRLLVLVGTPDPAMGRVLDRWRSTGGTVVELPDGDDR